jgi:GTP-binding protein Era
VAERLDASAAVVIVNKIDRVEPARLAAQLAAVAELGASSYHPVSARTGEGVDALVTDLLGRLPEGPAYYPAGDVSDMDEAAWVAELVREQLLARLSEELPYSVATRVTEWEWPRVRCEIVVERDSQKGMVIGKGGSLLKEVGTEVRRQMPDGAHLELHVVVDKNWQRRPDRIERLGY